MDGSICERLRERVVDETVLLDERQPGKAAARDRYLEMVAAARPVLDRELARIGKGGAEEYLERLGIGHRSIVASRQAFLRQDPRGATFWCQ